jgi:hypothetical protein
MHSHLTQVNENFSAESRYCVLEAEQLAKSAESMVTFAQNCVSRERDEGLWPAQTSVAPFERPARHQPR